MILKKYVKRLKRYIPSYLEKINKLCKLTGELENIDIKQSENLSEDEKKLRDEVIRDFLEKNTGSITKKKLNSIDEYFRAVYDTISDDIICKKLYGEKEKLINLQWI